MEGFSFLKEKNILFVKEKRKKEKTTYDTHTCSHTVIV